MKKTYLVAPLLIFQFVCYCKIFHNLTHKVNNPYLLDKNWMIALTVGLIGHALVKIIDAMIEQRIEKVLTKEKYNILKDEQKKEINNDKSLIKNQDNSISKDNGSKTSRFIETTFFMAIPIVLGSFMLNYLINPDSLKALDHAQNSTKAFFIVEPIVVAMAALWVVATLLACCRCCCYSATKANSNDPLSDRVDGIFSFQNLCFSKSTNHSY